MQAVGNPNNGDKKVVFKNRAPFTDCISEICNTQIDNTKCIVVIIPMYNLIEYSNNIRKKTTGSLRQYYRDEAALTDAGPIANFHAADTSVSLKFKQKIKSKAAVNGRKDVEIAVPLKYISNFWRTFEVPLINCEINLLNFF